MALALDPDVLIADEPTTALDVTVQAQILALLKELQRERRMGLILITHDMGVVADIADRVCLMYAGRVVEHAPVKDVFATPAHPYSRVLLRSIPRVDSADQDLAVIAGAPPELTRIPPGCAFHSRCELRRPTCEQGPAPALVPITADRASACHFWKDLVPE
jgi:oligopeptide transport system ATP-binding protein